MRTARTFRIIGTLFILLVLLITVLPASPALAAREIILDVANGKIGDSVGITGSGFSASTGSTDRFVNIYFSSDDADVGNYIDNQVTTYKKVKSGVWIDEEGNFTTTFTIPSTMTDGTVDDDVTSGTYFVYATREYTSPDAPATLIGAVDTFSVAGGEVTIDPEDGPVGTPIDIQGVDFPSRENIDIDFDGSAVNIDDGDDETDSSGDFFSTILVPAATAGEKTILITVGSSEQEVTFTVTPEIIVNPTSGEIGGEIEIIGTGFGRRADVSVYFNNTGVGTAKAGTDGGFKTTFVVPSGLVPDIYDVEAEDSENNLGATKFTITTAAAPPPPPEPTPTPTPEPTPTPTPTPPPANTSGIATPNSGNVGDAVTVSGTGFQEGAHATIRYGGEEITKAPVLPGGLVVTQFRVPPSTHGENDITIDDGTNKQTIVFIVESLPPKTPPPIEPAMGVKIKPPLVFKWETVTDESEPVTYDLQIASDNDFADRDILVDKTGLEDTEYDLTESETSELLGKNLSVYYWRIRATDAAANNSEWTGAGEFSITPPVEIPNWALYTFIGLGGILLFGVGYLIGRRSGLYY